MPAGAACPINNLKGEHMTHRTWKFIAVAAALVASNVSHQAMAQILQPTEFWSYVQYNNYLPQFNAYTFLDTQTGLEWLKTSDLAGAQAAGFTLASQGQFLEALRTELDPTAEPGTHLGSYYAAVFTATFGEDLTFTSPNSIPSMPDTLHQLTAAWVSTGLGNAAAVADLYTLHPDTAVPWMTSSYAAAYLGDVNTLATTLPVLTNADGSPAINKYFVVRDTRVPEASASALMALGLVGVAAAARRRGQGRKA
jgi:hypothetical protein